MKKTIYNDLLGRLRRAKKGHATLSSKELTVHDRGNCLAVKYYDTDIVRAYPDGSISLNSGGYRTVRTKRWMSEYLPPGYNLYSEKSVWWLRRGWGPEAPPAVLFQDGIRIGPRGGIHSTRGPSVKQTQALKKRVDAYSKKFAEKVLAGEIQKPGNGDCWYCLMRIADGPNKGKPLGDVTANNDHLLGHLEDQYYVPSLLNNALKEVGILPDPEKEMLSRTPQVPSIWVWPLAKYWGGQDTGDFRWLEEDTKARYAAALRRYLYRRLGISGSPRASYSRRRRCA